MEKPIKITVNNKLKEWTIDSISYSDIINLRFGIENKYNTYSIIYSNKERGINGILNKGDEIKVFDGTVFKCYLTNNS